MFKKLFVLIMAFTLVLAPAGFLGQDGTAEAKRSYKSGTKSFTPTAPAKQDTTSNSTINRQSPTTGTKASTVSPTAKPGKGGLLKGLLYGGIAGLLFGSLFQNLGVIGAVFGLLLNVAAIMVVIMLATKIFASIKRKKKEKDFRAWRP